MNYELVTLGKKVVQGKSIVTSNEKAKTMNEIGKTWEEFINEGIYKNIENKINGEVIGLYYGYENDMTGDYNFMTCCEVNSESESVNHCVVIPESKYAKFSFKGNMITDVIKAWEEIWEMSIDRKYSFDFEVYHNDSEDINNQTIDIFISVK